MPRAIYYRNDDQFGSKKSSVIYKNLEAALSRLARNEGRELHADFSFDRSPRSRTGTAYRSIHSIVSIGLTAHERLANVIRSSLIYIGPSETRTSNDDVFERLLVCAKNDLPTSRINLLGQRARLASVFLPKTGTKIHDLPPLNLFQKLPCSSTPRRVTIINHLADDQLARNVTNRFLADSAFFIECIGLEGDDHNRIRYVADSEFGDDASDLHIHIGQDTKNSERLRICDSWHSGIPVLIFGAEWVVRNENSPGSLRDEYNVINCHSIEDALEFANLLFETPSLYKQMASNGRLSTSYAVLSWADMAKDLVA